MTTNDDLYCDECGDMDGPNEHSARCSVVTGGPRMDSAPTLLDAPLTKAQAFEMEAYAQTPDYSRTITATKINPVRVGSNLGDIVFTTLRRIEHDQKRRAKAKSLSEGRAQLKARTKT